MGKCHKRIFLYIFLILEYLQCGLKQFNSTGGPHASDESLGNFNESTAVSFDNSDDYHYQPGVGEQFGSMRHTVIYFLGSKRETLLKQSTKKTIKKECYYHGRTRLGENRAE